MPGSIEIQTPKIAGSPSGEERRSSLRFALAAPMEYTLLQGKHHGEITSGTILDISTGGVCFTTGRKLRTGSRVELTIAWPTSAGGTVCTKLVIRGVVVRTGTQKAAVRVVSCEFRTHRAASAGR
jgi:hypothetical protein